MKQHSNVCDVQLSYLNTVNSNDATKEKRKATQKTLV